MVRMKVPTSGELVARCDRGEGNPLSRVSCIKSQPINTWRSILPYLPTSSGTSSFSVLQDMGDGTISQQTMKAVLPPPL
eukprot:scaffold22764_cov134-Cylindrotheca_fusiformis.AAC.1